MPGPAHLDLRRAGAQLLDLRADLPDPPGFLDGRHGLVLAVTAASGSFYRYSKLMFLAEKNKQ